MLGRARLGTGIGHLRGERAGHANRCLLKVERALPCGWRVYRLLVRRPLNVVSRRHRKVLKPRGRILRLRPGQQVPRRLADDELAAGGREDWHQADVHLRSAHLVPRQPDAVARAQLGLAEVAGELLGREGVFAVRRFAIGADLAVIVAVHDQLPLDGHCLVAGIVEVDPPAEAAGWLLSR